MNDLNDLEKMLSDIFKKYPDIVEEESEKVLALIVTRLQGDVVQGTPVGVGGSAGLRGSIFGEVRRAGNRMYGIVGSPLEYAPIVEQGRKPGPVSVKGRQSIELWVRRVLGISSAESSSVAFLVARKVAMKGFDGAFMFQEAWDMNLSWIEQQLQSIPQRVFNRL